MTSTKRLLAIAMASVLLLSAVASVGMAKGTAANDGTVANDALAIDVSQAGNDVIISVTSNESAVDGANVTVEVTDENATYADAGDYQTDENGTVELDAPDENVTVEVTAEHDDRTVSTTETLTVAEGDEEDDEPETFGQMVSSFVHEMLNSGDNNGPIGQVISDYVTSNNPGNAGNAPDHAGGPEDAGKPDDAGKSGDEGKPSDAGPENATDDDEQGPPEQAGQDDGDETEEEDGSDDEEDGDDKEDDDKRGNGKEKGNGR